MFCWGIGCPYENTHGHDARRRVCHKLAAARCRCGALVEHPLRKQGSWAHIPQEASQRQQLGQTHPLPTTKT